ncbi:MAG: peptide chain release factor 1 [Bacilli bacterium]|nr:peptide chain release factor 1 [Bacilli bacterium]
MNERLNIIKERYNFLKEELTKEEVYNDLSKMTSYSKELIGLEEIVKTFEEYEKTLDDIEAAKELLKDPEYIEFANEELETANKNKERLEASLKILLLPKDPNDEKNVVMEIRGAAGGDEANIFAGDLFRMYQKYSEKSGWNLEILHEVPGESGGYAQIEFMLKGDSVYSKFKYESGSHRVQRVPATESQGRVHTSTATVIVMPEAEAVDIEIKENDLKIDVYHSGGAGGQSVNTTDSAVRMTHLPTGIVVTCQNERSQLKNKAKALEILKTRLYDLELQKQEEALGTERRNKIGTGDRSEKIRTYNYPQNRVTDHRIGLTLMNLDKIMEGNIDNIIEALITEDQKRKMGE